LIWFAASGQQEMVRLRTVPLLVENLSDSLTITGVVPSDIEIRVSGTRRALLSLGFKRVHAAVDLSGARPGRQRIPLGPGNVRVPPGFDRRNITVISPTVVDLHVERLTTRRVQVALSTTGKVPENLMMMEGDVGLAPSWITIRGPAATIERIRSIPTQTLDLSRLKETTERELPLDYDAGLISCDPDRVLVTLRLQRRGERVLANVPPTVLVDSEKLQAEVLPTTVSLTLEGPASVLDTLSSGDVSVLLDLTGRRPAEYRIAPEVILPAGVTLTGISADTLVVRLLDPAGARKGKR
ncbi:MAG: CdaR family protein, partial [Candidatus Krumholzibacteria bacterium]|nr:CdaR family protein [Candidatus Krumholzibacteria bacterium]